MQAGPRRGMSTSPPPETGGAYIFDASTFLKGLRSISLRNLSVSGVASTNSASATGRGNGRGNGERDSASISSSSLRNLRAVVMIHDDGATAGDTPEAKGANGLSGRNKGTAARGNWGWSGTRGSAHGSCGMALLTTGVSEPTVNPTWPVSETSWLHADTDAEVLDSTRFLLLRVFVADQPCAEAIRHSAQPKPRDRHRDGRGSVTGDNGSRRKNNGSGKGSEGEPGPVVWECVIDVRGLTALPEGSRLSHLWSLPADCLLVEMSNGGVYAPDWVVQALSKHSALPVPDPAGGGRSRGGGSGGDTWRDDSDEEDDQDQEPLDQVLRRVLKAEEEAERGRAELAAKLDKMSPHERRACAAAESACAMEALRMQLADQEELLALEEESLVKEKRHLQAETLAVEELLNGLAEEEEAAAEDARLLESEKRETLKSHVLLEARRARLTAELQAIYPIKYQDALKEYTIRGLELPADLYSMDDERVSSALGYTAHLVCMLAKYLKVPLRYQVIYNASRSAVRDNVTGAGVAYPLFRKGVEKERFDRGVYLLGRDVEQMLTARGVPAKRGAGQLLRNLERLMSIEGV
eukprot:g6948.t1